MNNSSGMPLQAFDPLQEVNMVGRRRLPHWSQAGTVSFITWRTWDSMPEHVVQAWLDDRDTWLRHHGIEPSTANWKEQLSQLPATTRAQYQRLVSDRWNEHLDTLHGRCVLRQPSLSAIVAASLHHFDGTRYLLTDYVVMPNHVHLLVAFLDEKAMLGQCESWKRFTATQINRVLGRTGRFWQQDDFDHLVRSDEQFEHLRRYIAENPSRAHLNVGEFAHYSAELPR